MHRHLYACIQAGIRVFADAYITGTNHMMSATNLNHKEHYMTEDKVIYTSEGAADLLTLSANTLKNSRSTGILCGRDAPPYIKLGKKVAYRRSDLLAWLKSFPTYQNTAEEHMNEDQLTATDTAPSEPEEQLQELLR